MQSKLISVVVPSYNHSKFIRACLESIVNQTYPQIEIVIVDDGSKDDSVEIIKSFVKEHEGVKGRTFRTYFRTNHGAYRSINFGVEKSSASVIAILNSDDLFHPERLEHLSQPIFAGKTEFAMSLVEFIDDDAKLIPAIDKRCAWYLPKIGMRHAMPSTSLALFLHPLQVTSGNLVFTRNLFNELKGFRDYDWCHDYDFTMRATLLTEPILVSRKLLSYRYHGTNTISSIDRERARFRQEGRRILEDYLECAALSYQKGTLRNRFAATPYTWPHYFKEAMKTNLQFFSEFSFQMDLSLCNDAIVGRHGSAKKEIEVAPTIWPFLNSGSEAVQALIAGPGLVRLQAENLKHEPAPKMKAFTKPRIRRVTYESNTIGSLIETEGVMAPKYNHRLLIAGVFEGDRLLAVLRQSKSRGSLHGFRGFAALGVDELQSKDLKICWLDFNGKQLICRWPGSKTTLRSKPKLSGKVQGHGYIDVISTIPGHVRIEGWAAINGELPDKIELYSAGKKLPHVPSLRAREDLVTFYRNSRDHQSAGFRFSLVGDDIDEYKSDIEIVAYHRGKSLRLRKQVELISRRI